MVYYCNNKAYQGGKSNYKLTLWQDETWYPALNLTGWSNLFYTKTQSIHNYNVVDYIMVWSVDIGFIQIKVQG